MSSALVLCVAAVVTLLFAWPFRKDAVIKELANESFSMVTAASFHETYFPHPGCVLEKVVVQHNPKPGASPLMTIERIRIEGSFLGLFARHVELVRVEGMRLLIPPLGSEHFETPQRSSVVIDDLVADGAVIEVASRDAGNPPLKFEFRGFTISDIGSHVPASFKVTLSNPVPPGIITTSGKFGPWNAGNVGQTPVSGEYYFDHADLGAFHGIGGLLSSSGKYNGTLGGIDVKGSADVPLFAVSRSSHQTQLRTQFHAVVNAENGDVSLQEVSANFRQTTVSTQGTVVGSAGGMGKTASLEMASQEGRIQDLLLLIIKSPRAPMSGIVSFKIKVSLPPGQTPFLEKVALQGDFGVDAGSFQSAAQRGVNSLSQGARGEKDHKGGEKKDSDKDNAGEADPQTVLSDLKGHVELKNGTARLSGLSFNVPGALAELHGTYNLTSEKIDLHGTLKTQAEISKTTTGVKAAMLKVLEPFFKNKPGGYTAPIKITGTYNHPWFGLDLLDRDNHKTQNAKLGISRLPVPTARPSRSPDPTQAARRD